MRKLAGKKVLREIKVDEISTRGDVGYGGIDIVEIEANVGKVLEATKEGRERTGEVSVGEVKGSDGSGGGVARNTAPVAWSGVARVP